MEERGNGGEEGQNEDVRKEVKDTFHDKQVHKSVELPLLCSFVHLNRLSYKLDDNKHAHHCSMNKLSDARNHFPTGSECRCAKREIHNVSDGHCVIPGERCGQISAAYRVIDTNLYLPETFCGMV